MPREKDDTERFLNETAWGLDLCASARLQWWAILNTVANLPFQKMVEYFLTNLHLF